MKNQPVSRLQNEFRLERSGDHRVTVVAVAGELDLASSPQLDGELERISRSNVELVVVDLRELEFMDSTGISVLVTAHRRAQERGQRLGVVNGRHQVQRLLSLTGVAERLSVVDAPEELLDIA